MEEGNSIRDTLKDRFRVLLALKMGHDEAYEMSCDLADAAFDVLGVSPEMQDKPEDTRTKCRRFVLALLTEHGANSAGLKKKLLRCGFGVEELEAFINQ